MNSRQRRKFRCISEWDEGDQSYGNTRMTRLDDSPERCIGIWGYLKIIARGRIYMGAFIIILQLKIFNDLVLGCYSVDTSRVARFITYGGGEVNEI